VKIPLLKEEEMKAFISEHTRSEICEAWNISYGYASALCKKYGTEPKKTKYRTPSVDINEVAEYGKTHTVGETSAHFNVCYSTVIHYKHKYGLSFIRRKGVAVKVNSQKIKRTGEAQDMIRTLCSTYTDASIGRVFGYSRERIRQIRNEAGLE